MGHPARRLADSPETPPPLKLYQPGAAKSRRRTPVEARRAIASGVATAIAVWLVSLWAVSRGAVGLPDPAYGTRIAPVRQAMRQPDRPATIVTIGSSRTGFAVRAEEMSESLTKDLGRPALVANLAEPLMGPVRELLLVNRLREERLQPDVVLVEVFPHFLRKMPDSEELSEGRLPLRSLVDCDLDIVNRRSELRKNLTDWDLATSRLVPPYDYRFELLGSISNGLVPKKHHRYTGEPMEWIDSGKGAKKASEYPRVREAAHKFFYDQLQDFEFGGAGCEQYREIVALCRKSDLKVALILMPESPEFRTWYREGVATQVRAWVQALAKEHDVPLIDAWEWHEEADFCDGHHLTRTGARRFESRIRPQLLALVAEGRQARNRETKKEAGTP